MKRNVDPMFGYYDRNINNDKLWSVIAFTVTTTTRDGLTKSRGQVIKDFCDNAVTVGYGTRETMNLVYKILMDKVYGKQEIE